MDSPSSSHSGPHWPNKHPKMQAFWGPFNLFVKNAIMLIFWNVLTGILVIEINQVKPVLFLFHNLCYAVIDGHGQENQPGVLKRVK